MAWLEVDYFNNLGPIDSRITILLTVLGCLLLGALIVYLISAIRNRGKPKPERHGTGNLGGLGGYSGRGVGVGGPPNSSCPPPAACFPASSCLRVRPSGCTGTKARRKCSMCCRDIRR